MRIVIVRVLGPTCKRWVFIAAHRIAIKKNLDPKVFRMQLMPPPWAWSPFVFWASLASDRLI